ncbi:hypothetical protein ACHAQJ_004445 [Trichoderma viride]
MEPSDDNNNNNNQNQSSLMGGHAQWLKGTAETAVGSISGSQAWSASGEQDKAAGLAAMKKAGEKRDPNQGYGKAEEWAGKLTGCEGMQKEGVASSNNKRSD